MLVEDAEAVRKVLSRALERLGYTILEAADGQAALTMASRHQASIDMLLTNAVLPELSGRQLAERLREVRPSVRVIFMSGSAGDMLQSSGEPLQNSGEPGAWASFLQKPFTPKELARKVRVVLDARDRGHATS